MDKIYHCCPNEEEASGSNHTWRWRQIFLQRLGTRGIGCNKVGHLWRIRAFFASAISLANDVAVRRKGHIVSTNNVPVPILLSCFSNVKILSRNKIGSTIFVTRCGRSANVRNVVGARNNLTSWNRKLGCGVNRRKNAQRKNKYDLDFLPHF